jgi:hypothetical protein
MPSATKKVQPGTQDTRPEGRQVTHRANAGTLPSTPAKPSNAKPSSASLSEFDLRFGTDQGPVWLHLTGRPGVKEVIRDEFI